MLDHSRLGIFYQISRHGGMAAAARALTVSVAGLSRQMSLLEREVGTCLFSRSPFRLTRAGRKLYRHLPAIAHLLLQAEDAIRPATEPRFRLGIEDELRQPILLPAAADWMREESRTQVEVRTDVAEDLRAAFTAGELDFLLTLESAEGGGQKTEAGLARRAGRDDDPSGRLGEATLPRKTGRRILATRPLVLLVPKASPIRRADHFWRQKRIAERLAAPAPDHPVMRSFQAGLRQGGIKWPTQILTDSLAHVLPVVASGVGVGVTFDLPANLDHPGVRALPVQGFAPVAIACHWRIPVTRQIRTALRLATEALRAPAERRVG